MTKFTCSMKSPCWWSAATCWETPRIAGQEFVLGRRTPGKTGLISFGSTSMYVYMFVLCMLSTSVCVCIYLCIMIYVILYFCQNDPSYPVQIRTCMYYAMYLMRILIIDISNNFKTLYWLVKNGNPSSWMIIPSIQRVVWHPTNHTNQPGWIAATAHRCPRIVQLNVALPPLQQDSHLRWTDDCSSCSLSVHECAVNCNNANADLLDKQHMDQLQQ